MTKEEFQQEAVRLRPMLLKAAKGYLHNDADSEGDRADSVGAPVDNGGQRPKAHGKGWLPSCCVITVWMSSDNK